MRPGPPPKPTRLKLIQGNPGRRPLNKAEARPEAAVPACPAELPEAAKREWRRVARELHQLGLLTRIDRAALAAYCEAWSAWIEAVQAIQRTGPVVKAPSGYPILNPHLAVANQAFARMRALLAELGMTPAARSRITVTPLTAEPEDEGEQFFA